jgi:ornithine cyclodeaminase/alanine dehydrogenase-like protein (mu-crystallin family)
MDVRLIDAEEVRRVLTMPHCIDVLDTAMRAVSAGDIVAPARLWTTVAGSEHDLFGLMPGSTTLLDVYGAKVISLHPGNGGRGLPAIQGFICLFDRETGTPRALIEGASVTAIRTAAASGLATRELSRRDASSHGILGTGVQAATHIEAVAAVRQIRRVVIWGRDREAAGRLAADAARSSGVEVIAADDPAEAAACDIVSTVTASREPVLHGEWVRPGTHVNLVGAHEPDAREADSDLVASAKIYVDLVESALNEAGDLLIPIDEGRFARDDIVGEIGSLLAGDIPGRAGDADITVYKSLGIVAQDLFAADYVLRNLPA